MTKVKAGFSIIGNAIKFIFKHPKALFPFLLCWLIYGFSVFYIFENYSFEGYSTIKQIFVLWGFMMLFTMLISISSLILLELIEQNEKTGKMSLFIAIKDAFVFDLIKTLPVIFVWSIIKLVLLLLNVLASSLKTKKGRHTFLSRALSRWIDRIDKGIRLQIFLMLPGIAWDGMSPRMAYDNGKHLYLSYFTTMLTGYGVSGIINSITFIPLLIYFLVSQGRIVQDYELFIVVIYMGVIWSFGMMVEQLFCAEMYLWVETYGRALMDAEQNGTKKPESLYDVTRPSFIDDVQDMIVKQKNYSIE